MHRLLSVKHMVLELFILAIATTIAVAQTAGFTVGSIVPATINPSTKQTTTITYSVPTTANYRVLVNNTARVTVRTINRYSWMRPGTYRVSWNGKDDKGNIVPNGTYTVLVTGVTTRGAALVDGSGLVTVTGTAVTPPPTPTPPPPTTGIVNSVDTIISDMTLAHEAYPHGVPLSWNWAQHPEINLGNNPGTFKAMIAWGQLYEAAQGNPATNTRVQIRNIRAYLLSKRDGQWHQLQSSLLVEGEAYREDFSGDVSKPGDVRRESDGSISVKAGGGYNFHYWPPSGRTTIVPTDVAGIFTTCQARLILDNPTGTDDRSIARYVLDMGGDYWLSLTASWAQNQQNNDDIGMGRFKYVTADWRAFNMCTVPATQLRQTPPPIE